MTQLFEDTQVFLSVYDYDTLKPIFIASNLGSILSFVYLFYKNKMSSQSLGLTLEQTSSIKRYEQKRQQQAPWLFD